MVGGLTPINLVVINSLNNTCDGIPFMQLFPLLLHSWGFSWLSSSFTLSSNTWILRLLKLLVVNCLSFFWEASCFASSWLLFCWPNQVSFPVPFKGSELELVFSVIYGALLTKTNRISRIFDSARKSARRPSFISPKSQVVICMIFVSIQVKREEELRWRIHDIRHPDVSSFQSLFFQLILSPSFFLFEIQFDSWIPVTSFLFRFLLLLSSHTSWFPRDTWDSLRSHWVRKAMRMTKRQGERSNIQEKDERRGEERKKRRRERRCNWFWGQRRVNEISLLPVSSSFIRSFTCLVSCHSKSPFNPLFFLSILRP